MSAPADVPSVGELAEEQVRRTIKALRSAHDIPITTMCERAGVKRATFFSRMNGTTSFTAGEVAELADLFGVEVADIYSGRVTLGPTPPTSPEAARSPAVTPGEHRAQIIEGPWSGPDASVPGEDAA